MHKKKASKCLITRSNSSHTSRGADFQTRKKQNEPRKTRHRASTCATRKTYLNTHCRQPQKKAQSLTMNGHEISMKVANSLHHGSACQSNKATVKENQDNIEDYTFSHTGQPMTTTRMKMSPAEQTCHIMPRKQCRPADDDNLDSLVNFSSHSVSSKLCQSAAKIVDSRHTFS